MKQDALRVTRRATCTLASSSLFRLLSPTLDLTPRMQDRRRRPERRARFDEIRAELSERVRDACGGIAPAECDALLSRMARVQLKYEVASVPEVS